MKNKNWFEVSKDGLKELQAGKPKHYIVRELIQNAWDENITYCIVELNYSKGKVEIKVRDDNPEGFKDLSDVFTLFKHTDKRINPEKRGRFNMGEKQAIALASKARITTTKGTIIFDENGRHNSRLKKNYGSEVILWVKMKKNEYDEIFEMVRKYIQPEGIKFIVNGNTMGRRMPERKIKAILETEIEKNRIMTKTQRKTEIWIYRPFELYRKVGEKSKLYEMGIPICEIDCQFDISIQQKIPLGIDRETVSQRYLSNLYAEVLNVTYEMIDKENSSDLWIREAIKNKRIEKEAVDDIIHKRFGEKVVIANSFDPNSVDEAISRGYNVVYGSEMDKKEWDNIKRDELIKSSTEMFGKSFVGAEYIEPNEKQKQVAELAKKIAERILRIDLKVSFIKSKASCGAEFGNNTITFNVSRLSKSFWEEPVSNQTLDLILHELAHSKGNHTEMAYHQCLTKMAGELIIIALKESKFFKVG